MQNRWDGKDDMKKMQQEAIRRVQEMQSKAKEKISQSIMATDKEVNRKEEKVKKIDNRARLKLKRNFESNNLLKGLTQDSEKNLITILILLLMEEETDLELLLSLMYLLV